MSVIDEWFLLDPLLANPPHVLLFKTRMTHVVVKKIIRNTSTTSITCTYRGTVPCYSRKSTRRFAKGLFSLNALSIDKKQPTIDLFAPTIIRKSSTSYIDNHYECPTKSRISRCCIGLVNL